LIASGTYSTYNRQAEYTLNLTYQREATEHSENKNVMVQKKTKYQASGIEDIVLTIF
jgi:hypothetical protein